MARTVKRLTKEAEERLTEALGEVARLVNAGATPDDAVVKVAGDYALPAGHVNLMVQTFNIGRSEAHRRTATDPLEKAAEFPLADPAVVLDRLYPDRVKTAGEQARATALAAEYARPPDWARPYRKQAGAPDLGPMTTRAGVKVAAPPPLPVDPALVMKRAFDAASNLRRTAETSRSEAARARDQLMAGLTKLGEYFRTAGCQPFPVVRTNVAQLFGKKAELLMKMIGDRNRLLEKQALSRGQLADPVIWTNAPYSLIRACLGQAETVIEKNAAHEAAERAADTGTEDLLRPFAAARPGPAPQSGVLGCSDPVAGTKAAGVFDLATGYSLGALGKVNGMAGAGGTPEDLTAKAMTSLDSPTQSARIRNMQTSSMLTDLMANDSVIAGYHPDEVLRHFNEVSQLAPRAAGNEGVVRAVLRKRLAGGANAIDPYDVDLLLKIENQIKDRDDPSYGQVRKMAEKGVIGGSSVLD